MVEPLTVPKASGCSGSVMFGNLWILLSIQLWQFHNFNVFPSTSEKVEFLMVSSGNTEKWRDFSPSWMGSASTPVIPVTLRQDYMSPFEMAARRWDRWMLWPGRLAPPCFFCLLVSFSMEAPWCWYIDLQNWVILFGRKLINIPAPLSVWVMFY